jgi:type II secretory pathway component PulF
MPDYAVLTLSAEGKRERRRLAGRDPQEVCTRLRADGVFVERIAPAGRRRAPPTRARIPAVHRIEFYRQMETLLSSGVLIADALGRLKESYPDRRTRRVLAEVHAQVAESRTSLSRALALFPRSFPPGVVALVEAGEEGGAPLLAERFGDLAERTAYEEGNRGQVLRACAYPAFVFVMAAALYGLLLGIVFPRISDLLASLGGELPPLARHVVALSRLARAWLPALAFLVVAVPATLAGLRVLPPTGLGTDRLLLRLPFVGAIYRDLAVALVCKVFGSLHRANRAAPESLDLCSRLVGNRAFRRGLEDMRHQLTARGSTLAAAFSQSGLFPPLACLAIEAGEQSGRIPEAMDRVSAHFNAQARSRIAAAIAVFNPLMTLGVVGGAGILMISFFQAVYQVVYAAR